MKDPQRFLDASIFINWLKVDPERLPQDERALISGYILHKLETGEGALTSVTVKDEVAIWLSRYKAPILHKFMNLLLGYTSLEIVSPTIEDQLEAARAFEKHALGYTDSLSLSIMNRHGVNEIYSSDTGFDSIANIKRIFEGLRNEDTFDQFRNAVTKMNSE